MYMRRSHHLLVTLALVVDALRTPIVVDALRTPIMQRRAFLAAAVSVPLPAVASSAGAAALKARVVARLAAEEAVANPKTALPMAKVTMGAAAGKLQWRTGSGEKWIQLRRELSEAATIVRATVSANGDLGADRSEFLAAVLEVDNFAYLEQQRVFREKLPNWDAFVHRNDNIDLSAPTASLEHAVVVLDRLIAASQ